MARGRLTEQAKAHGTMAPTSVRWLEPGVLLSTGIDSRTRRWRVTHDQVRSPSPLPNTSVQRFLRLGTPCDSALLLPFTHPLG